jgi:hypothetical protein
MPKIYDIVKRMPEAEYGDEDSLRDDGVFVPISDHLEPFSKTHNLRVWPNAAGQKKVKFEAIPAGELPARRTVVDPAEFLTWEQALEKIKKVSKAKAL